MNIMLLHPVGNQMIWSMRDGCSSFHKFGKLRVLQEVLVGWVLGWSFGTDVNEIFID